jgi:hypothetical protein
MIKEKYDNLHPDHELVKRAILWGSDGDEVLFCQTIDDYIELSIDDCDEDYYITVYGYERMSVSVDYKSVLDHVLEHLDEEYGDPDGDYTLPNENMIKAAREFAVTIENEYEPWTCQVIGCVEVDVKAWIEKNKPEWIIE